MIKDLIPFIGFKTFTKEEMKDWVCEDGSEEDLLPPGVNEVQVFMISWLGHAMVIAKKEL